MDQAAHHFQQVYRHILRQWKWWTNRFMTHTRCAIATARSTASKLVEQMDVPALGMNVGWHRVITDIMVEELNQVCFPCSRGVIPGVQNFLPRIPAPTRAHCRLASLHSPQDRRWTPTFLGDAKLLPSVSPEISYHTSSSPPRPFGTQSQGFPPSNLDTGAPHGFRRVQG
jgi:hypothetical protein